MSESGEFLSARQVQAWLGISKPTLLTWLRRKDDPLPGVKIGGRWKFRRSAVLEWWQKKEDARFIDISQVTPGKRRPQENEANPVPEELKSWLQVAARILSEDKKRRK